jgi:cytochrome c-type biogenesis protein CcmH/NrfG
MSNHSRHEKMQAVPAGYWSSTQSYVLAVITLLLGVAVGYLVRGSATAETTGQAGGASGPLSNFEQQQPVLSDLTARAVEPLIPLPNDPDLLINIANAYYDGKDYAKAIDYYQKALRLRPQDVDVRTDMGTAIWYSGDADGAIRQYEQSLKFQPTHAQTLFNLGIVMWQGKKDGKGAIQFWEKLLASNPGYADRAKVQQMIDQVRGGTYTAPRF